MGNRSENNLGLQGEKAAVRFLQTQGYRILATQHRNGFGEIDIIAETGKTTIFVEVKTRSSDNDGLPFESVNRLRQDRMSRAALVWLKQNRRLDQPCRLDIISILWKDPQSDPEITHYPNAFEPSARGQFF